jgi:hypothetical protein
MAQFENAYSKAECALRRLHPAFGNVVRLRKSVLLLVLAVGSRSAGAAGPRAMREGTHKDAECTLSIPFSA